MITKDSFVNYFRSGIKDNNECGVGIEHEKFVFLGAKKTLENIECVHFPAIEKFYENYGYDFRDVFKILKSYNFSIYTMSKNGLSLLNDNFQPKIGDYLAIKNIKKFTERMSSF